jgi:hypothetical protein
MVPETASEYSLNGVQHSLLWKVRAGCEYLVSRSGELTVGAGVAGALALSWTS